MKFDFNGLSAHDADLVRSFALYIDELIPGDFLLPIIDRLNGIVDQQDSEFNLSEKGLEDIEYFAIRLADAVRSYRLTNKADRNYEGRSPIYGCLDLLAKYQL